jgi:hypothetical protein
MGNKFYGFLIFKTHGRILFVTLLPGSPGGWTWGKKQAGGLGINRPLE